MSAERIDLAVTRPLRRAVLRPHQTVEELATHEPPDAAAFGVLEDGEPLSVGIVGPEGGPGAWRLRGMATVDAARGRGLGGQVLEALLAHAAARGATRVWCNARLPAVPFYERAGFAVVSEEFTPEHLGPHVRMERVRAD